MDGKLFGVGIAVGVAVLLSLVIGVAGCTSYEVEAGHVGYVYHKPLLTSGGGFVEVKPGPHQSNFMWRQYVTPISVLQYTVDEPFELLAKDDLKITFKAHCMVGVKSDSASIRDAVEKFCGQKWYDEFYKERFRSQIYNSVREYDSRGAKEHRADIGTKVLETMKAICKDTPFVTYDIVIGNVEYPLTVQQAVEAKLAAQQQQEMAVIEIQIAEQKAKVRVKEAEGIAESQRIINASLTNNYLRHEYVKALETCAKSPNTTIIYVPLGRDGLPFVADVSMDAASHNTEKGIPSEKK